MNLDIQLSNRLRRVANYIPKGEYLADIGSDHAYLPTFCVANEIVNQAIAGEVVIGPFQSAQKQVQKVNMQDSIDVRLGDGLEVIQGSPVTVATIAGMGGALIANILERGLHEVPTMKRLILQPNVGSQFVREWCLSNGWTLVEEEIMKEDGKIYEILVFDRGEDKKTYLENREQKIQFGPFLLSDKNEIFKEKWSKELQQLERVLSQLELASQTPENIERLEHIREEKRKIEEVL